MDTSCTTRGRLRALASFLLLVGWALPLAAGGGPRNVLVVVNQASGESIEIGSHYLRARAVPEANLCRIDTSSSLTVSQSVYQNEIRDPIRACIASSPYASRIDYIVLTRGLPIRVNIPDLGSRNTTPTSIAALLQVMDTDLDDAQQGYDGQFLGRPNPYRNRAEWFSHAKDFGDGRSLYIVTMLSGFWTEDAKALVDRSLASDGNPPSGAGGTFYLEEGRPAADVRNSQMPQAVANLKARGFDAVHITQSDPEVRGAVVASHVNSGTYSSHSRSDIDANDWPPGAIVDVLESFGLVPQNFTDDGNYSQVPVTFYLSAGATGGHGTVFEPYNVAFPDADMLEPYVDGFNMGETFYQGIPYLYWMNLVLGDPLAAPWAERPAAMVDEPMDGDTVSGTVRIRASATTADPAGIQQIEVFVGDGLVDTLAGGSGQTNWDSTTVADGPHRIEVVAYEDTARYTQATAGITVTVDNAGLSATIQDPPDATRVADPFDITVEGSATLTEMEILVEGRVLAGAIGSPPFLLTVDPAGLGRGAHDFRARGRTSTGEEVLSPSRTYVVEKAPRIWVQGGVPQIDPAEGPASGGTSVTLRGWNFEPGMAVLFAGVPAPQVDVASPHLATAETPPGAPGPVTVGLENPLGGTTSRADAFTYLASPCPVTTPVEDLRARRDGSELRLLWQALDDPCFAGYRVWSLAAYEPSTPPLFPGDWTDRTAEDLDGDPGGDAGFRHTPPAGLALYLVTGEGTDGSTGPR